MNEEREAFITQAMEENDYILSSDELRSMFMQRKYSAQDVERLLISHAALKSKVKHLEDKLARQTIVFG